MKNKFYFFVLIFLFVAVSLYKGDSAREVALSISNFTVNLYFDFTGYIKNSINKHFRQASEIESLKAQNLELEKSVTLLSTFASELNSLLADKNSSAYAPKVSLVKALGYVNISDYNKIWLKFDEFDPNEIYGLIYQGRSAGIVVSNDGMPMAILQNDPKSTFSVYIGNDKIPGVAVGNFRNILISFIPAWLEPKIGEEVFTSGLDGLFFSGVPVGKVVEILDGDLYKNVIVEPYVKLSVVSFLYVVLKEK